MSKKQTISVQHLINLAANLNKKVDKKSENTLSNLRRISAQLLYGVKLVNTKGKAAQEVQQSLNFGIGKLLSDAVDKAKKTVTSTPDRATTQMQQVANYSGLSKEFGSRYHYLGAGTNLGKNIKESKEPINALDRVAMIHDFNYLVASSLTGDERAKYLKDADQLFLDQTRDLANNSPDPSVKEDASKANKAFGVAVFLKITDNFVGKGTKLSRQDVNHSLMYVQNELSKLLLDPKVVNDPVLKQDVENAIHYYNEQSLKYESGDTDLDANLYNFRHTVGVSNDVVPSIILPTLSIEPRQEPQEEMSKVITTRGGKPSEAAAVEERKDPEFRQGTFQRYDAPFGQYRFEEVEKEKEEDIKASRSIDDIARIYGISILTTKHQQVPILKKANEGYYIVVNEDSLHSEVGRQGIINSLRKLITKSGLAQQKNMNYMIKKYLDQQLPNLKSAIELEKVQKLASIYNVKVKIDNTLGGDGYKFKGEKGKSTEFTYNPKTEDAVEILYHIIHQRGLDPLEGVGFEKGLSINKFIDSKEIVRYAIDPKKDPVIVLKGGHEKPKEIKEEEKELEVKEPEREQPLGVRELEAVLKRHGLEARDLGNNAEIKARELLAEEEREAHAKREGKSLSEKLKKKEAIEHDLLVEFLKEVTEKRQKTLVPGARLTGDLEQNVDVLQGKQPGLWLPQIPKTGQRNLGLQIAIGSGSLLERSPEQEKQNREWYKNFRVVPLGNGNGNQDFIADPSMKPKNTLIDAVNENMKMRFSGPLFNPAKVPYKQTKAAQPSAKALALKRPELRNQCQGFQVMWNQAQPIREPGKPIQMARDSLVPFATSSQNINSAKTRLYHPNIIVQPDGKIVRI